MSDSTTVEMQYEGVKGTLAVPQHRVERYQARGWKRVPQADNGEKQKLTGKALDEALDAAGLSKDGTADEKRARLDEHPQP